MFFLCPVNQDGYIRAKAEEEEKKEEEEKEEEKEGEEKKNIIKALLQFSLYNLYTPRFEHLFKLI